MHTVKVKWCYRLLPVLLVMFLLAGMFSLMAPAATYAGDAAPPVLSADITDNMPANTIEITFEDDADWRTVISAVYVDDAVLEASEYTTDTPGKIIFNKDVFTAAKDYSIVIKADGYADASVTQKIEEAATTPPVLSADISQNLPEKTVEITFTDDLAWRNAITALTVDGNELTKEQYTVAEGKITLASSLFPEAKDYTVLVQAVGYDDATVIQAIQTAWITVTGDGVKTPTDFTRAEVESMTSVPARFYSTVNTWPTKKIYVAEGVKLADLLTAAGIKDEAKLITFKSSDGFTKSVTLEQLNAPRYYYPGLKENHEYFGYILGSPDNAEKVDTILALKSAEGDNPDYMSGWEAPLLVVGQQWLTEQTNELFVKYVKTITVSTETPEKWKTPTANIPSGTVSAGTEVELDGDLNDADKVHYTTDGTNPTIQSPMYNWIALRWWGSRSDELKTINHPIRVDRSITLKAIVIGPGKTDSDIVTYEYRVADAQPPALTRDISNVCINQEIEITFPEDQQWVEAITAIYVDGTALTSDRYTKTFNKITFMPGVFTEAKDYNITISATDFKDAGVIQKIVAENVDPPALTADTANNAIGQAICLTFTEDADWQAAITQVSVDGAALAVGKYTVESGTITITAGILNEAKDYSIAVQAIGYNDANVIQAMRKIPPVLNADTTNFITSQPIELTFAEDADWQAAITGITVNGSTLTDEQYTVTAGNINIAAGVLTAAENHIVISAEGYKDAAIIQNIKTESTPVEEIVLTITGAATTTDKNFTLKQLQKMRQYEYVYSCINTWPTKKWYVGKGVKLRDLLDSAGMKGNAQQIKFIADDGYYMTLTVQELLKDKRYIFPNFKSGGGDADGHIPGDTSERAEMEPILALISAEGTDNPSYMSDINALLLMMGQRAVTEQTGPLFVKKVKKIEVLTTRPEKWDAPQAKPGSGTVPPGTMVTLSNLHNDDDKIHYTVDGSTPTIESPIYNWIARRWWSSRGDEAVAEINHPIELAKDTTIKAITIGPGKSNSDVATFKYKVTGESISAINKITPGKDNTISFGEEVVIKIPAGALKGTSAAEVKIEKVAAPPTEPSGFMFLGNVYEFSVDGKAGCSFNEKVTITFSFDPKAIGENETPAVYFYDETEKKWVNIGGEVSGNTISVKLDHFTKFAVMAATKTKITTLTDITGHWAENNIKKLVALGAITGYPDGTFKPNNNITRAEFAAIFVRAFKLETHSDKVFTDTAGHWAKDVIATAAYHGIINGYDKNTFGPNDFITREQMAAMMVRAKGLAPVTEEIDFADSGKISAWAKGSIAAAAKSGIIKGYGDNTVRPLNNATRAEAVMVIMNTMQIEGVE